MYDEISAAVLFIMRLVSRNGSLVTDQVEEFGSRLSSLLTARYRNHWFPEKPFKGQGYRCIRMNEVDPKDPLLEAAARECGLGYEQLGLPVELTVWVDPKEVCCRFGEHKGSYCTVAAFTVTDKVNCGDSRSYERVKENGFKKEKQLLPCSPPKRSFSTLNRTNAVTTSLPQFFNNLSQVSVSSCSPPDYCYFVSNRLSVPEHDHYQWMNKPLLKT